MNRTRQTAIEDILSGVQEFQNQLIELYKGDEDTEGYEVAEDLFCEMENLMDGLCRLWRWDNE